METNDPNIPDTIEFAIPICFAFNKAHGTSNVGSFSVECNGNKYFAVSCFHVFASKFDFNNYLSNPGHQLRDVDVVFRIGDRIFESKIFSFQFGNYSGNGMDYAVCEVGKEMFDLFHQTVDVNWLNNVQLNRMRMFGAASKYNVGFHKQINAATITIESNGVLQKLHLYKIYPVYHNVQKGDSGSMVYYKATENGPVHRGIIISRDNDAAYMARIN